MSDYFESEKEKYAQRVANSYCGVCGGFVPAFSDGRTLMFPRTFCACEVPTRKADLLASLFGPPVKYEPHYNTYGR